MADFARSTHPQVQAQLDRLTMLSPHGDRLGLDRIRRLLDRLGRPQDALPPVFHIAGTNGKGSTCAFLRASLEAGGHKVHLFTSPHLVRFNERIRIAGSLIEDGPLAALLEEVLDASSGIEPSFFEVTTAVAFLAFGRTPADACVIEVGLGGRLDATNIIDRPLICGIAGIGLDHRQWLGRTLGDIASEKAAIAKADVPLVTQRYPAQIARRVQVAAESAGAQWLARGAAWDARVIRGNIHYRDRKGAVRLPLPGLPGRHQSDNAALAVALLRHQDALEVSPGAMAQGVRAASWPARLQKLEQGPLARLLPAGSELWVDGGHNGAAARQVADHVRRAFSDDLPLALVFGCLSTKSPADLLKPFAGLAAAVVCVPIPGHDSRSPADLAALAERLGFATKTEAGLENALEAIPQPARILVFGSLYLAGQALALNDQAPD